MCALSDLQVQRKSVSFSTGIVYTNITIATSRVYIFVVHFQVHSGVFLHKVTIFPGVDSKYSLKSENLFRPQHVKIITIQYTKLMWLV